MLTFGEVRKLVASYAGRAGKCESSEEVAIFARQVMENLLYSGSQAAVRKVCLYAVKGCVAFPPEVEVPLKVRIDRQVANVWNKFFTFHSTSDHEWGAGCYPAGQILFEDGAQTPLAHELPEGGSVVGVLGSCDEGPNSYVIIQGKDITGREIYTSYRGEQIAGEKLRIEKGQIKYGKVPFGQVTAVLKPRTNGYVSLFAMNEHTGQPTRFLADWSPAEEKPLYRKYKISSRDCGSIAQISMLCRVRLKDFYHDNENTFFDNSLAVTLAAQRIQSEHINDVSVANYKQQAVENTLDQEAGYKKISGSPVDVYRPLSGGAIRGIVR